MTFMVSSIYSSLPGFHFLHLPRFCDHSHALVPCFAVLTWILCGRKTQIVTTTDKSLCEGIINRIILVVRLVRFLQVTLNYLCPFLDIVCEMPGQRLKEWRREQMINKSQKQNFKTEILQSLFLIVGADCYSLLTQIEQKVIVRISKGER